MPEILLGAAIRQSPAVLSLFLDSLRGLESSFCSLDYFFIDDNRKEQAAELLVGYRPPGSRVVIRPGRKYDRKYLRDDRGHRWNRELIDKVATYKNRILKFCRQEGYDYLFLVDSDLYLHSETLSALWAAEKNIISEIFWTRWNQDGPRLPQVWLYDAYTLYEEEPGRELPEKERRQRKEWFLSRLRRPGVYRVGGLGACTLLSRKAVESGVDFTRIYNLSFTGEDRHFCVRAAVEGFELYVDTHYPAYHIYREEDTEGLQKYILSFSELDYRACQSRISRLLREGLETLESPDFRGIEPPVAREHYTSAGWKDAGYEKKKQEAVRKKAVYRAEFRGVEKLEFKADSTRALAGGRICLRGSEAGEEISRTLWVEVETVKKKSWQIDGYRITGQEQGCPERQKLRQSTQKDCRRIVRAGQPRLTLGMLLRNEADRYLEKTLAHAAGYIDEAVLLDDASTDGTVDLCREILNDLPCRIVSRDEPGFENELQLRKQLWELIKSCNPDWILVLDADEMFEKGAAKKIRKLLHNHEVDVYGFRLYDFWTETHYREDKYWNAHYRYSPFLLRYQPGFTYRWQETPLHCGRLPANITWLPATKSELRIKHFGWVREEDRRRKYERYLSRDPDGKYGSRGHYESILEAEPNLVEWEEGN